MIPANRSRRQPEPREANAGKPWDPPDLFFLMASVERGMTIQEVAGFAAPAGKRSPRESEKEGWDLTATLVEPKLLALAAKPVMCGVRDPCESA